MVKLRNLEEYCKHRKIAWVHFQKRLLPFLIQYGGNGHFSQNSEKSVIGIQRFAKSNHKLFVVNISTLPIHCFKANLNDFR